MVNASAGWFVDKYISDPWIDELPAISLSRNCNPLVLVLGYDEVYAGQDKLGPYEQALGRFEDALPKRLKEKIEVLNERMSGCITTEVWPYCGPDNLCLLTVEGVRPAATASLVKLLRMNNVDFARMIVRHRFRQESAINWSATQTTKPVKTTVSDR